MTRVLVTGARGLLGTAIAREFAGMDVSALGHGDLDITDADAVRRTIGEIRPALIVNCAAYNDVDGAQDQPAEALAVNAIGIRTLVSAAAEVSCRVVHYSTDFVFDGEATRPYTEEDEPHPRSFYGLSKLLGEWLAAENRGNRAASAERRAPVWILRVESLFGDLPTARFKRRSLHTIIEQIKEGEEVPVFVDRTVSPSYTIDVARATRALFEGSRPPGLYHCVNSGAATWAEIAEEAGSILGRPARLKRITLASANLKAPRPRYCAMSNARLAAQGIVMPPWQDALRRYLSHSA